MFDFAWSEMAVIAAVALVLIGPKDMPVAIRSITGMIKKARRMAGEFQTHVDEMLREANLDDIKSTINDIRNFDLKTEVERHVDPDGSLRGTFAENPLEPTTGGPTDVVAASDETPALEEAADASTRVCEPPAAPPVAVRPAFMPPGAVAPELPTPAPDDPTEPPAFIPPEVVSATRAQYAHSGHAHIGNG